MNKRDTSPFVTVSPAGRLFFSKPCTEFLKNYSYAVCLFDVGLKMAAVKPCLPCNDGYKIAANRAGSQAYISVKSFAQWVGIIGRRIPAVISDGMIQFSAAANVAKVDTITGDQHGDH